MCAAMLCHSDGCSAVYELAGMQWVYQSHDAVPVCIFQLIVRLHHMGLLASAQQLTSSFIEDTAGAARVEP